MQPYTSLGKAANMYGARHRRGLPTDGAKTIAELVRKVRTQAACQPMGLRQWQKWCAKLGRRTWKGIRVAEENDTATLWKAANPVPERSATRLNPAAAASDATLEVTQVNPYAPSEAPTGDRARTSSTEDI